MTSLAAVPDEAEPRLQVERLSKTFGPAQVLREVALRIRPGELHGLVGQNGCGKSTLVKILTGVYDPDPGGVIALDGRQLRTPIHPLDAREAGLSVVHQDLGLIDDMTVWENVRVGRYRARGLLRRITRPEEVGTVQRVLDRMGSQLDPRAKVGGLDAEDRAAVAIARAVLDHPPGGGLIIFDESTRALGLPARERFFALIRSLQASGTAVLLISHQLEEIVTTTDRVTVLRDGVVVESSLPTDDVDEAGLTRLMLGRHLVSHERTASSAGTAIAASLRDLHVADVKGIDLTLRRGEIVGFTGLVGSGFVEAAEALAGARRATHGLLEIEGEILALSKRRASSADFIAAGVAIVPERRLEEGLAGSMTVLENLTLPRIRHRGNALWSGRSWQVDEAQRMIERLDIRPADPDAPVATLSGGNQQKVLIGKWLAGSPRVLVLSEPTQAVDVGARHAIIDAIRDAARAGCAVVVASVDAADLAVLCDRVLVFREQQVACELAGEISQDEIIHATFGERDDQS
jgi:ribose transport system ATP-binding protein